MLALRRAAPSSLSDPRSQLLHNKPISKRRAQTARTLSAPPPADYAKLAGMSDASVKKATGCTWERWVKALDYAKADSWTHKEIAEYVHTRFKVRDWWTPTVTVGYERIKGLRARGQRRDGTYEASKSKVFSVPLDKLFDAFNDSKRRARWLSDVELDVRHATPNKSMRLRWPDGSDDAPPVVHPSAHSFHIGCPLWFGSSASAPRCALSPNSY